MNVTEELFKISRALDEIADEADVKLHMRLHDIASYLRQIEDYIRQENRVEYETHLKSWRYKFRKFKSKLLNLIYESE